MFFLSVISFSYRLSVLHSSLYRFFSFLFPYILCHSCLSYFSSLSLSLFLCIYHFDSLFSFNSSFCSLTFIYFSFSTFLLLYFLTVALALVVSSLSHSSLFVNSCSFALANSCVAFYLCLAYYSCLSFFLLPLSFPLPISSLLCPLLVVFYFNYSFSSSLSFSLLLFPLSCFFSSFSSLVSSRFLNLFFLWLCFSFSCSLLPCFPILPFPMLRVLSFSLIFSYSYV